jgi:tetratricopeptide (TPR) repeat protein
MKLNNLVTVAALTPLLMVAPASAENLEHTRQLLSTKSCPNCDLTNVGLVFANLSKANLQGADLSNANLSRANLSGADLTGANLTGAILYGANLGGAKLNGTNLSGADLRGAFMSNAEVDSINVSNANLQGVVGLPPRVGKAEDFFNWALVASDSRQYGRAIENYSQALSINPTLAPAYLGRGIAYFKMGKQDEALADSRRAAELFQRQEDQPGYQTASNFVKLLETPEKKEKTGGGVGNFFSSLFSIGFSVLRLFAPF